MIVNKDKSVLNHLRLSPGIIFLLLFIPLSTISGQKRQSEIPPLRERLFFGGSFGLQFGTITNIEISPLVGLWVLPRFAIAAGPKYQFYRDQYDRTEIYGGRTYMQFVVFQDLNTFIPLGVHTSLYLHSEYEALSLQSSFWDPNSVTSKRFMVNTVLAGVGISQQIGKRGSINFMVLWTLNDSGYEIYGNPEIRVGFTF
jgi:hypothetical protein